MCVGGKSGEGRSVVGATLWRGEFCGGRKSGILVSLNCHAFSFFHQQSNLKTTSKSPIILSSHHHHIIITSSSHHHHIITWLRSGRLRWRLACSFWRVVCISPGFRMPHAIEVERKWGAFWKLVRWWRKQGRIHDCPCRGRLGRGSNELGRGRNDLGRGTKNHRILIPSNSSKTPKK